MPVQSPSQDYMQRSAQWSRIRDAQAGEDAVKNKARVYLRAPDRMSIDDFDQYSKGASFFPATSRTLSGLVGAIHRKEPQITFPKPDFLSNVDQRGTPFSTLSQRLAHEVLAMGRVGVLVDVATTGGAPYLTTYNTEAILNVRQTIVDGKPQTVMVTLAETIQRPKEQDRFSTDDVERIRVLELARAKGHANPIYMQSVYEKVTTNRHNEEYRLVEGPIIPLSAGEPLTEIPFVIFGPTTINSAIEQSPLLGLVDMNFSHFRTSAEHENALWFAGTPQFVISGNIQGDDDGTSGIVVGAGTVWLLEKDAKAEVLQGAAENVAALANTLKDKESRLAVLGARLLEPQQRGNPESHETVSLRHRGEESIMAMVAQTLSRGLTVVLKTVAAWDRQPTEKITVSLNTDFLPAAMSAKDVLAFITAWQTGGIGAQVLFNELQKGERVPADWDLDDFVADIENNSSDFLINQNLETPSAAEMLDSREPQKGAA